VTAGTPIKEKQPSPKKIESREKPDTVMEQNNEEENSNKDFLDFE
jgi:hypothetical protein